MTHHMLKGYDRAWIKGLTNAFLIRAPERVLASYTKKWSDVSLRDIGFVEQAEIFDMVADHLGKAPPVVDADDILPDPRGTLTRLCAGLRHSLRRGDAVLARRPQALRRRLGAALVQRRVGLDRLRRSRPREPPPLPAHLQKIADEARPSTSG